MTRSPWIIYPAAGITILLLGFALAVPYLNHFPSHIHAWAQADWYSIAIGFTQNGHDLFHPETLIFNKQYPSYWFQDDGSVVTSVDFPLHEFVVSILMGLFGTTEPWVFRLWTLLWSLAGMWFLFLLSWRITGRAWPALLPVLVAITSPVYAYYFNGFQPSALAISFATAGLWAYVVHWQERRKGFWQVSVALLALAALVRTSFAVPLVAVCGFEALRLLLEEIKKTGHRHLLRSALQWLAPVALAVCAILGYMLWNKHLRETNGSLFLNELRPPRSWEDVQGVRRLVHERWHYHYFSRPQLWLMLVVAAVGFLRSLVLRRKPSPLSGLLALYLFGEGLFFVAMMLQYADHDYYFLDSFFLPLLLCFIWSLRGWPSAEEVLAKQRWRLPAKAMHGALTAVMVLLGIFFYNAAKHNLSERYGDKNDRALLCMLNFEGSAQWLDQCGVPRNAKVLTPFAYPQNSPFILMQRKGYALMWPEASHVDAAFRLPFDYVVIEDDMLRAHYADFPALGRLRRIAGNGRLSLCLYGDTAVTHDASQFFLPQPLGGK
ncbi:MAG: glycosyltransferase family 39 protein [Bacteroidales bacterium]|nr:glycosyltransferase family 39 protein [Bacteroidales bacterium]